MALQLSTGLKNALLAKKIEEEKLQAIIKNRGMTLLTGSIFNEEDLAAIDSKIEADICKPILSEAV